MTENSAETLVEHARTRFAALWNERLQLGNAEVASVSPDALERIHRCVNSSTKSYRYVLTCPHREAWRDRLLAL